jgi:hypothetical protein
MARYHLRPSQVAQRNRLDSILGTLFEDSPDLLVGANLPRDEEVCIRSLTVVVPIRLDVSDTAVTKQWGEAIAAAVNKELSRLPERDSSPALVRYRSRGHALLDLVRSISSGNRERAWAWRQMGLVGRSESGRASELVVEALAGESQRIVPVLAEVARLDGLANTSALLTGSDWWTLAMAALAATRVTSLPLELLSISASQQGREHAVSLSQKSRIWAARPERLSETFFLGRGPVALSILVVLETEPALLILDPARGFDAVAALAERLAMEDVSHHRDDPGAGTAEAERSETERRESIEKSKAAPRVNAESDIAAKTPLEQSESVDSAGMDATSIEDSGKAADAPMTPSPLTQWGGLLFLLHLVDALGVPAAVMTGTAFRERSLPWVLHRLSLSLIPTVPDDPAALAFAGHAPGSEPPISEPTDPDAAELQALGMIRARLIKELREILERRLDEEQVLLDEVTRREARIEAGPGWLVVHLSLTTTSTDIRRAGLDLDPGYLPWLGVVLKFSYE